MHTRLDKRRLVVDALHARALAHPPRKLLCRGQRQRRARRTVDARWDPVGRRADLLLVGRERLCAAVSRQEVGVSARGGG